MHVGVELIAYFIILFVLLTVRFRIILRRDQVHKIACNHCIAENMELSPLTTSETALCWNAVDYSDGEPEASQFAVRFKVSYIKGFF